MKFLGDIGPLDSLKDVKIQIDAPDLPTGPYILPELRAPVPVKKAVKRDRIKTVTVRAKPFPWLWIALAAGGFLLIAGRQPERTRKA